MNDTHWQTHHELTKNDPPSVLLVQALEYVEKRNRALDIGDGALKDARYLLEQGFVVDVVDQEKKLDIPLDERLRYHASSFDDFTFEKKSFDIASAMFALPFNPPETFSSVFQSVKESLVKGGVFCGQLFGIRDEWINNSRMTFHTKEQIDLLLSDMEVLSLVEREKDSHLADGTPKHWHLFHIIARKP